MMMFPGIAEGQKPSVNASVSASVAGSVSQDGVVEPTTKGGVVVDTGRGRPMFVIVKVKEA